MKTCQNCKRCDNINHAPIGSGEYREKLKQESQTVYAARVASGIYQEA